MGFWTDVGCQNGSKKASKSIPNLNLLFSSFDILRAKGINVSYDQLTAGALTPDLRQRTYMQHTQAHFQACVISVHPKAPPRFISANSLHRFACTGAARCLQKSEVTVTAPDHYSVVIIWHHERDHNMAIELGRVDQVLDGIL